MGCAPHTIVEAGPRVACTPIPFLNSSKAARCVPSCWSLLETCNGTRGLFSATVKAQLPFPFRAREVLQSKQGKVSDGSGAALERPDDTTTLHPDQHSTVGTLVRGARHRPHGVWGGRAGPARALPITPSGRCRAPHYGACQRSSGSERSVVHVVRSLERRQGGR